MAMKDMSARPLSWGISRAACRRPRQSALWRPATVPEALLTGKTTRAAWRDKPSFYAVSTEDRTIIPTSNGSRPSAWAPRPLRSKRAISRWSPSAMRSHN